MLEILKLAQEVGAAIVRGRVLDHKMIFKDPILCQHLRGGKIIGEYEAFNDITNEGKNHIFGVEFHGDAQLTSWYIGLIDNAGFTGLAATDVMNSHTGWTESVAYTGTNRPAWSPGAASGQSITNATAVTFNINATKTINGIFVTSDNTLSGTAGKLWATASFAAAVPVNNADQIKVTYTVSA